MPIFELETTGRWTNSANYEAGDAFGGMIVRASNAAQAREIAANSAGDEGRKAWLDDTTTVEELNPDGFPCLLGWC